MDTQLSRRALAKALTEIERGAGVPLGTAAPWDFGDAMVVGITGPPGVGKSTLTDRMIGVYLEAGHSVAVLAIDPSSPITQGALLGDRIRMGQYELEPKVMIRSVATRGAHGGLSRAVPNMARALAAGGFDRIIVETVGVGQIELDVSAVADVTVVVLAPGAGDAIQAAKAGILEVADVFVVNKSDHDGALRTMHEVGESAATAQRFRPVLLTQATTGEGCAGLIEVIEEVGASRDQGDRSTRTRERVRNEIAAAALARYSHSVEAFMASGEGLRLVNAVIAGECTVDDAIVHVSIPDQSSP